MPKEKSTHNELKFYLLGQLDALKISYQHIRALINHQLDISEQTMIDTFEKIVKEADLKFSKEQDK